jgi:hypothetical protein
MAKLKTQRRRRTWYVVVTIFVALEATKIWASSTWQKLNCRGCLNTEMMFCPMLCSIICYDLLGVSKAACRCRISSATLWGYMAKIVEFSARALTREWVLGLSKKTDVITD